uniref:Uncharacterized protein n=1 Tax=Peronospora matthiolae TaxID=2874970 RepID=A0AAV1VH80_9STRA
MFAFLVPPRGQSPAQHRTSAQVAKPMATPRQEAPLSATNMAAAIGNYGMPTACQRKLNIRFFDEKNLYKRYKSVLF